MKRVLILGGSHRDIPLIKAAQELGYYVITLGDRDYYLGHTYSDKTYKIDFNDLDAIKKVISGERIDAIIPGCGEESYLNTVKLSHQLSIGNFDTYTTAKLLHNKYAFKEFCLQHDISTPKGHNLSENKIRLSFPIVVKPTDLSGGRGVQIVYTEPELNEALKEAAIVSDDIFLEEHIEGQLIAYSVFIKDKNVEYGFTGKDDSYLNPYLVTTAYPIEVEQKTLVKLKSDINKIAHKLDLVDGAFHAQVIIKDSIPYIIDITRRIPGDLYPDLIEYCDTVKYSKAVVKAYLGEKISDELIPNSKQNFVIRHCVMPDKNGVFEKLVIDKKLKEKVVYRLNLISEKSIVNDYLHTQIEIIFIRLDQADKEILNNLNTLLHAKII